jgi:hypothetical protein
VIEPEAEVTERGTILVRNEPGMGYSVDEEYIKRITVREETIV